MPAPGVALLAFAVASSIGDAHVPGLVVALLLAFLIPIPLVLAAYWRGRFRRRRGLAPGWEGDGWTLAHAWLSVAVLIGAQAVVLYLLQPSLYERWFESDPPSSIEIPIVAPPLGEQLLMGTVGMAFTLFIALAFVPWRLLWTRRWSAGRAALMALGAFVALRLLIVLFAPLVAESVGEDPQQDLTNAVMDLAGRHGVVVAVLVIAGLAPLVEEVLFRGVLLTSLARHVSFFWANVIQAALFAGMHFTPALSPFFFAFGIVAGLMMRAANGLLPSILMHVLNNAAVLAALWWLREQG